jgi:hypothetical protein
MLNRSRAIAGVDQRLHQRQGDPGAQWLERRATASSPESRSVVAQTLRFARLSLQRSLDALAQMLSFIIEPSVEIWRIGDEHSRHEIATIKRDRIFPIVTLEVFLECDRIAPEKPAIHADVILAAADYHGVAQRVAKKVERLT